MFTDDIQVEKFFHIYQKIGSWLLLRYIMNIHIKKKIIFVYNSRKYLQMKFFIFQIRKSCFNSKLKKICYFVFHMTRKCSLRGHILAPPEGLRAPGVPGVNIGVWPHKSGGDSKAIKWKKKLWRTYGLTMDRRTDVTTKIVI